MDEWRRELQDLQARIRRIEERLGLAGPPTSHTAPPAETQAEVPPGSAPAASAAVATVPGAGSASAASAPAGSGPGLGQRFVPSVQGLMASGAGIAFVLAAVYFLKLVYDRGWLTPERQLVIALLAGVGLIVAGVRLARQDRRLAAYLPAAGTVILYLTVYAAHVYYRMVGPEVVLAGVAAVTLTAVWLHRTFQNSVYALAAVVGAYLFPVLIPSRSPEALDLIVYFAAWSALFCWAALQEGQRTIYVLALWLALLGFDMAWRASAADDLWVQASVYHFLQFLLFAATAVRFSVRWQRPMQGADALVHGLALSFFYAIEYAILSEHAPRLAPLVALASAVVVVALFALARASLREKTEASTALVGAYVTLVTVHVLFFEVLPNEWFAWGALLLPIVVVGLEPLTRGVPGLLLPARLVAGILFAGAFPVLLVAEPGRSGDVPLPWLALFLYAAVLYVGAWRLHRDHGRHQRPPALLYAGHAAFLVATVKALPSALWISATWAILGVALLTLGLRLGDRVLGRSALLVFAAFALKVMLYDLGGSPTLIRVGTLVLLGTSLYVGGWLYQRIDGAEDSATEATP